MKAFKIATAVLVLLIVAILLNSIFIGRISEDLAERIKALDLENMEIAAREAEEIYSDFKRAEKYISITVSHDDLTNIEESFSDIMGAFDANMKSDIIIIKSRLSDALSHLGRLSGINLDSII